MTGLNENETCSLRVQLYSAKGLLKWLVKATFILFASNFYTKCVQSAIQNLFLMYIWNQRIKIDSLPPPTSSAGIEIKHARQCTCWQLSYCFDGFVLLEQIWTLFEERSRHWIAFNCVGFVWDREQDWTEVLICYWCQLLAWLSLCIHHLCSVTIFFKVILHGCC